MKIAIVGSGISGLGAAWILSQKYEVHLFEAESRLGGHSHTVKVQEGSAEIPIDTGFLVYNEVTYPNLIGFLKTLQVETAQSDMSLAVRAPHRNFEWAGGNLDTVFAQRKNLVNPRFLMMLSQILKFHREAEQNLLRSRANRWSLGELILQGGYGASFRNDYLLPIGAAIWSTPEKRMEDFPAETFLQFFINHKLLQVNDRPIWRTVKNGSIQYVNAVAKKLPFVHRATAIDSAERHNDKVILKAGGESLTFDKVVFATHAPITRRILKPDSQKERDVLAAFETRSNRTLLHTDSDFMPKRKKCWSSWNVVSSPAKETGHDVSLTYYMNKLQPLATKNNYFVTLNPRAQVQNILREFDYHHPQFDQKAIDAQKELTDIQGVGGVYYAGAWTRYGFHEDGLLSAVKVAELMGVRPQWNIT